MYELPPILSGSEAQQIAALRAYLVRMARKGGGEAEAQSTAEAGQIRQGSGTRRSSAGDAPSREDILRLRQSAARLRDLIIKTAEDAQGGLQTLSTRIEGIDGQFFYIRYSPVESPTAEQMTTAPQDDTAYMGVCSTNQSSAPTDPSAYVWSRILGEDALSLQIISSNGNIFKNGAVSTVLTVKVWSGDEEITEWFDANDFRWTRVSADAAGDSSWNQEHFGGTKSITITPADVNTRATFFCDLQ